MSLINGATYRFKNRADGNRSLNVYGNSPSSLANVCLWTSNDNDICQQWVYRETSSTKYLECKGNSNLVLDLYTGNTSTPNVKNYNAHVYTKSSTSYINIEDSDNGYIKIKLVYNGRYLTANQNSNGTSGGKDVNAAGNVYFYNGGLTDHSQEWLPVLLEGGADTGEEESDNPYVALDWDYVFTDNSNDFGYYGYDPNETVAPYYHKHFGIDVICDEGVALYAPAAARVYAVGAEIGKRQTPDTPNVNIDDAEGTGSMGYFIVLKMDDLDPVSGKTMYVRYLHMKQLPTHRYNDRISKGEFIGYVGNTGASDTAHLHLDVNTMTSSQWIGTNMTRSNTINPVNFFPDVSFPSHYYNIDYYG